MTNEKSDYKSSFPPVSDAATEILILGTLPGDKSIEIGEYFAHPRNRFWKIIAEITGNSVPHNYSEKMDLLRKTNIGLWNVLKKAKRPGSLDTAIQNEVPNDIPAFIADHPRLKIIGFDGRRAEALYDRYFTRDSKITYVSLPGCSPANARFNLSSLCDRWKALLHKR